MNYIGPLLVIVAALVALSGFIISKKPELKGTFEKIAPYQGFLGVGLLAWGIYDLYHNVIQTFAFDKSRWGLIMNGVGGVGGDKLAGIALIGYIISEILLGFMLGFGLIATWIPGESGAEKGAVKVQKTLLGFALPIGLVGLICAILWLIKMPSGY